MYFTRVNAQIRAISRGKRSLDDVVLALLARTQKGESVTPADWEQAIVAELGAKAGTEYHDMLAGKWLKPPINAYGPCFYPRVVQEFPQELGFDPVAFNAEHRIKNLDAASAAAAAGLKEGDEVIDAVDVGNPSFSYTEPMTVKIRRSDAEQSVTFVPRGKAVTGYRWMRDAHVPDSACKV
jgi:predicted metalloprotease with PDZ domain